MVDCNSEQDAARTLGYTQNSWDNLSGYVGQPASSNRQWMQLTDRERRAAIRLGYRQTLWDGLETVPAPASENKAWSELSDGERRGAMRLGYNQQNWDDETGTARQPEISEYEWEDMDANQQNAARALGYSRTSWDGPRPESTYRYWAQLSGCGETYSCLYFLPVIASC